ncbi:MAG: thiamine pyrophosphate-binding protein [Candidatus Rokubacteria bacterium]|nr:thiamine pyrophosphate-binding protein [Candidatus Rokubacteria bacterium]
MKAYRALAAAIAAERTEVVFGVLGDGNMHVVSELVEVHGVRFVAARHEQAAVAMADGYSRSTGRPGVCTVTHGPGLTQTGTPLTAARLARSPVVLVAGDTALAARHHGQNIDQQTFALATAGAFQPARLPRTLAEDVQLAFRHVRLGRGPIVLNVGVDLQGADLAEGWRYVPAVAVLPPTQRLRPDPVRVASVARLLASARRPVVLAGWGAVASDAREPLVRLADRVGAVLTVTLRAKGWFAGHPFDLGLAGGFSSELTRAVLQEADCVVAFGASLNGFTVDRGRLFPRAQVVHVDVEPDRIGHFSPVQEAVLGDARATAEALLDALPASPSDPGGDYRTPQLAARLAAWRPFAGVEFVTDPEGADPREVALVCDEWLPRDRVVVVGIGHFTGYPAIHVGVEHPRDLILPWHLGAVGQALPVAVGVAAGRASGTVVAFEGDGGLMMSLAELETAARCRIPLLIVVLDDGGYGAEFHLMAKQGLPTRLALFDNPDLVAVARSLGLQAFEARTAGALRAILADLGPLREPTLVRVRVSRRVVNDEIFRALTG